VLACYQRVLARDPDLAGRVVVDFVIGQDGRVVRASAPRSTLPDATTIDCVVRAVMRSRFQPSFDGREQTMTIPFHFVPR
jgi:TonB family protein